MAEEEVDWGYDDDDCISLGVEEELTVAGKLGGPPSKYADSERYPGRRCCPKAHRVGVGHCNSSTRGETQD